MTSPPRLHESRQDAVALLALFKALRLRQPRSERAPAPSHSHSTIAVLMPEPAPVPAPVALATAPLLHRHYMALRLIAPRNRSLHHAAPRRHMQMSKRHAPFLASSSTPCQQHPFVPAPEAPCFAHRGLPAVGWPCATSPAHRAAEARNTQLQGGAGNEKAPRPVPCFAPLAASAAACVPAPVASCLVYRGLHAGVWPQAPHSRNEQHATPGRFRQTSTHQSPCFVPYVAPAAPVPAHMTSRAPYM